MARPETYTDELAAEVVERLSNGEPLAVICRDAHMPCDDTVRSWAEKRPEIDRSIARARETGADVIAWRSRLTIRGFGPEHGGESTGDTQRDKAIVDHDLKLLAKWNPKKWGDIQRVAHGGDPDGAPIQFAPVMFRGVSPKKEIE